MSPTVLCLHLTSTIITLVGTTISFQITMVSLLTVLPASIFASDSLFSVQQNSFLTYYSFAQNPTIAPHFIQSISQRKISQKAKDLSDFPFTGMFFPQAFMASLINLKTLFAGYLINKAHTDHIIKLTTPEVCAPIPSPCSVSHPRHLWFFLTYCIIYLFIIFPLQGA